jgi:hypothetical protein
MSEPGYSGLILEGTARPIKEAVIRSGTLMRVTGRGGIRWLVASARMRNQAR